MSISNLVRIVAFATPALAIVAVALALTIGSRSERVAADVPHAGLDFSIAVSLTQDGANICNTTGGPTTCVIPGETDPFTVKIFLNNAGGATYLGYDANVIFSGAQPVAASASSANWPDCGFPASIFIVKEVRMGCAAGISVAPSTYTGQLGRVGGTCAAGPASVTLRHGETDTALDGLHSEAVGTEVLTIQCGIPTGPTPTNTVAGPTNTPGPPTNTVPPTSTRTPTRTPTNSPTRPPKALGDVNDDGSVDSEDAFLVLDYEAGNRSSLVNLASADVNDDGDVNSIDALFILWIEAELI